LVSLKRIVRYGLSVTYDLKKFQIKGHEEKQYCLNGCMKKAPDHTGAKKCHSTVTSYFLIIAEPVPSLTSLPSSRFAM
jgi:hypothetical protein